MRRTRGWLLGGSMSILALTSIASAQPADFGMSGSSRPIRLMLGGGGTVPIGELKDFYSAGYNVQGSLLLSLAGFPIKLRTDVNYSRLRLKDLIASAPNGYGEDDATLLGGLANLTLALGGGLFRPYIIAGLGAFKVDPPQTGTVGTSLTESSVEFAVNGGAGVQIRLFGIEAFVESRVHNIYTDKGIIDTKGIQMIPVTFGIIF